MNSRYFLASWAVILGFAVSAVAEPLRVYIRAGVKTHGPNQHDHPRFLSDWTRLLSERGMRVEGGLEFPDAAALERAEVLVIYAADGMKVTGEDRERFENFLRRGGGLVVIHDGVVSGDQHEWAKQVQGGAWRWDGDKPTRWYEGEVGLYFVDTEHPITRGLSNFDWTDEIYHDLDMAPGVRVLATSFHSVFVIAPQLWTYERTWEGGAVPYRAFVSLPGHEYDVFETPHYRALLLRGMAWAGKREDVDEYCRVEEVSERALKYPAGGPTAPELAASKLQVHPEFELKLVASEPLIEKVISLDWAPDGRLWVAETPEYPSGRTVHPNDDPIRPGRDVAVVGTKEDRPARDRISWLEDTDGDGVMDAKRVFYEGLELVTSLVFHEDGVIVQQAPDILWLRDTSGDGKADKVETLYTGFGTADTHAVINNMRWGLDGWIYSAIGYSAGQPRSGDGSRDFGRVTAGVIRFRPDGTALEQVASGSCNTWGLDVAPDGELFYVTATCGEHLLHVVMPEKVLARGNVGGLRASQVIPEHQRVWPLVQHERPAYLQIDWVGMFTAASGSCIYNGGAWPERWDRMHFLHEPTVSLVHNDVLLPRGPTYVATKEPGREETEFIAGTDLWFRPIHARVGPDGALYVVDWYNQAAIHNDTRGPAHGANNAATRPDRDHHFGRIWRVQHKEADPDPRMSLSPGDSAGWIEALKSRSGWLRMTAHRLLGEKSGATETGELAALLMDESLDALPRIHALWLLEHHGQLEEAQLRLAIEDADPVVRKNGLQLVAQREGPGADPDTALLRARIEDSDARARLWALIALGAGEVSPEIATAVVEAWPGYDNPHVQSAAVGVAAQDPLLFFDALFQGRDPDRLVDFASHVARMLGNRQDPALAATLVRRLVERPAAADVLKRAALESMTGALRPDLAPDWGPELRAALSGLLRSEDVGLAGATLPLVARWDRAGTLRGEVRPVIRELARRLGDDAVADEERGRIAVNLLGVRRLDDGIVSEVTGLLGSGASVQLQRRVIEALGDTSEAEVGRGLIEAYDTVAPELFDVVFGQLIKRADWSLALVEAVGIGEIDLGLLGPAGVHRLRTHGDRRVSSRANEIVEAIQGPRRQEMDTLIAQLAPLVMAGGAELENGRRIYTENCAQCHVFGNEGRDLAPNLTGMGAHGTMELLVHILDPNRMVEPNFLSTSIETQDGSTYDGVITGENQAEVTLRNATADYTIRKSDIASRYSTGLSLMPEGYEALGGEGLRDLLAFLCADEDRYRILDLAAAFTVNTGAGIYTSREDRNNAPSFRRHGLVKVGDVPFDVVSPEKAVANAVVLRGGRGYARTLPQRVEFSAGVRAQRLHFLGGIGGWAFPVGGEERRGMPVANVTLHFVGGDTEEWVLRNGVEFAEWSRGHEVPGSRAVPELARRGQVRVFNKEVRGRDVIERISIESYGNEIAPTFIAITAEMDGSAGNGASRLNDQRSTAEAERAGPGDRAAARVLVVGAGDAHDFPRWFLEEDSKILTAAGAHVTATGRPDDVRDALGELDVLYLSNNAPFKDPETRRGIVRFAEAGKGLILVHAGLWYNWRDWPEYNRILAGGGSRGHDRYGEFEVEVTRPEHPLMEGVPGRFTIRDELYWFEPESDGTPIEVLATAHSPQKDRTYPMIFVVRHPTARIVGITLGHDGAAHQHPAYVRLLQNALRWVTGIRAED
jgi:uncharacterized protein